MISFVNSTSNDLRGPSPGLWQDCPWQNIVDDPNRGIAYFNDTMNVREPCYGFTNVADKGGVLSMSTQNNDNQEVVLQSDQRISFSTVYPWWFESRVKAYSWDLNVGGGFIGLAGSTGWSDSVLISSDVIVTGASSINLIGFTTVATATAQPVKSAYNVAAGTVQYANAAVFTTIDTTNWVKFGIKSDGRNVSWWINGVMDTTTVSASSTLMPASGTLLCPIILLKNSSTTAIVLYVDWVRFAQKY
jgi:hypothetical protein